MRKILAGTVLASTLSISAAFHAAEAASAAIEAAKGSCLIGERIDGYLGVVDGKSIDATLKREMNSVNIQRKAAYAQLAADRGVTIETTGAIAAKQLIERADPGECVQNDKGAWVKVPG
ncbi:MAG: YdbL family protein [Pseudomonadota bacterium]